MAGFQEVSGLGFPPEQRLYFSAQFGVGAAGAFQVRRASVRIPRRRRVIELLDSIPAFRTHGDVRRRFLKCYYKWDKTHLSLVKWRKSSHSMPVLAPVS